MIAAPTSRSRLQGALLCRRGRPAPTAALLRRAGPLSARPPRAAPRHGAESGVLPRIRGTGAAALHIGRPRPTPRHTRRAEVPCSPASWTAPACASRRSVRGRRQGMLWARGCGLVARPSMRCPVHNAASRRPGNGKVLTIRCQDVLQYVKRLCHSTFDSGSGAVSLHGSHSAHRHKQLGVQPERISP